jgi:hypothetical protein
MFLLKVLKNKFFLVSVGLVIWLLYFDKNDLFTQYDLIKKCDKLNAEKNYYISEIENNKIKIEELQHNKKSLETFARENYLMKRDNEDVFVFVEK